MAKKILLVDDESDTAAVFQTVLKQAGYDVTVAVNGQGAISAAKTGYYDLILLDQMMPDLSGNDVLQILKSEPVISKVPVAMLTNFSHDELVTEALGRGAVDYILKYQISHEDLVKKVKEILGE
ncbi:MAG: response regulator [Candidatus Levybacteria bacterium]|nr:response regulator [Candidatus Levybacteria bacterium]